jgi:hypothetical protein
MVVARLQNSRQVPELEFWGTYIGFAFWIRRSKENADSKMLIIGSTLHTIIHFDLQLLILHNPKMVPYKIKRFNYVLR